MNKQNKTRSIASKWLCAASAAFGLVSATANAQITFTPTFSNVWSVVNSTDMGTGNNKRGIAIDPTTTNVVYNSTVSSNHFATLSAATGAYLGSGNPSNIVAGGTLALLQTRVSDDGFVYSCNLSGSPASTFRIYRWPSSTDFVTPVTLVGGTTAGASFQWRAGDYWDLRGSGANTEIVVTGNGGGVNITTNFVIFRATDAFATNFTNYTITIPGGLNICGGG